MASRRGYLHPETRSLEFNKNVADPLTTCNILRAAQSGDIKRIQLLLNKGNRLDIKDNRGWISLHQATVAGHIDCITFLLKQKNYDYNSRTHEGETALFLACVHLVDVEVVKVLIKGGVNINKSNNEHETPLHVACRMVKLDIIHALLDAGAELNCQDFNKFTPLHEAVTSYNLEAVELLVQYGAALEMRDMHGRTPLFTACCYGNQAVAKFLIQHNADVNARSHDNSTPLMLAAQDSSLDLVQLLLQNGANPNLTDINHLMPLHFAAHNNNKELLKLLLDVTDKQAISTESEDKFVSLTCLVIDSYSIECLEVLLDQDLGPSIEHLTAPSKWFMPEINPVLQYKCSPPISFLFSKTMDNHGMKMLKLLLNKGFPTNAQKKEELPPLVALCTEGVHFSEDILKQCLEHLLTYGCDIAYSSISLCIPDAILASCMIENCVLLKPLLQQCVECDCDDVMLWIGDNLEKCSASCVLLLIELGLVSHCTLIKFSAKLKKYLEGDHTKWEPVINILDSLPVSSLQAQCRRAFRYRFRHLKRSNVRMQEIFDSLCIPLVVQHYLTNLV